MMMYPWEVTLGYFLALCLLFILIRVLLQHRSQSRRITKQLEDSERYLHQITSSFDAIHQPVWIKNADQSYLYCNTAFEHFLGLSKVDIIGSTDEQIQHHQTPKTQELIPDITSQTTTSSTEVYVPQPNSDTECFQVNVDLTYDDNNTIRTLVGYAQQTSQFKERENQLLDAEIRVNEALKLTKVGIWEWNVEQDIWFATPSYFTMLGYPPVEGTADRTKELEKIHPEDREHVQNTIKGILNSTKASNYYKYQARIRHYDGNYRWISVRCIVTEFNEEDKPKKMLGVRIDINDMKKAHEKVEWLAHHDSLTKLPNRVALNKTFNDITASNNQLALLFIDLDNFKTVNDTLGHTLGDKLLIKVAERMQSLIIDTGYVARQGGDEFIILLPSQESAQLTNNIKIIEDTLSARYNFDHHQFFVTSSIGISLYPKDGQDFDTLCKHADTAMYHAKHTGKNRHAFFSDAMNVANTRALILNNALHDALERHEFSLHYQPQISLSTGKIIGAEALIRWESKELGTISPGEFIPLAEETGQILAIGEWVIRETARQLQLWIKAGIQPVRVAINLSYAQFQIKNFPEVVASILKEHDVPAHYLEIELTEHTAIKDPEHTISILEEFQKIGIKVAIDDFGTGYSSLSYLQRFPIHKLKIDQSFVRNMITNSNDKVIVGTIALLAQQLGISTIAEGVETKEQLEILKEIGCDNIQGYLISRPIPADEFQTSYLNNTDN